MANNNLLSQVQSKVLALASPLIATFEPYKVSQIRTAEFSSNEDFDDLLERFKDVMPGAYLSVPSVSYDSDLTGLRVVNPTLQYGLLVGISGRWEEAVRQDFIFEVHDRFAQYLFLRPIPTDGIPGRPDFLRPNGWEYRSDLDKTISTFYSTFSISVRNWAINEPA